MAKTAMGTGKDNRIKLLDAAAAVIADKGMDRASLSEIARASGLSKGTLYYYYASKNDLIFDMADRHMADLTTALFKMIEENQTTSMEDLLFAFFSTLLASKTRSRLHLYLVREAVSGHGDLKKRFQATYARWFSMVDDVYEKMGRSKTNIPAKAAFLVAVADGFILQTLLETQQPDIQTIVRLMLRVIEE
jgi:AcrR family transcriptional regulator